MEKHWLLLAENYAGMEKNAINLLYAALSEHLRYVLPIKTPGTISQEELSNANLILIGQTGKNNLLDDCIKQNVLQSPAKAEGYSIYVGDSVFGEENQMIAIAGFDAAGVLYGCMDFCNKYLGKIIYDGKDIWANETFEDFLNQKLNGWQIQSSPAIGRRAIWTWGHVIYDYRNFFKNMAKLRLNEVVIWNDVAPLNAKDVVEYAHSLNIKVIWGFAWGWNTSCRRVLESYDANLLAKIKAQVLETYEKEYSQTGADGIYFQTFTEHAIDSVGEISVAQMITELVNDIAASLYEKYPQLHIQFGLHATSVRNRLEYLKKVDKRIHIVWEDCGSFPYDYYADRVSDFEETLAFTEATLALRGEDEKWGAVLKGMLKLDWTKFKHFHAPYILGERTKRFMERRQFEKDRIWKLQQAGWIENAECLRRILEAVAKASKDCVVQALVEDSMFENKIAFPVALYAEMLWAPNQSSLELIGLVSKYPCVQFSNI